MSSIASFLGPIHGHTGNIGFRTVKNKVYMYQFDSLAVKHNLKHGQLVMAHIMGMVSIYMNMYRDVINVAFSSIGGRSPLHSFRKVNFKRFVPALTDLATRKMGGEDVTASDIATAITTYAAAHPDKIVISKLNGCNPYYLTGAWPSEMLITSGTIDPIVVRRIYADGTVVELYDSANQVVTPLNPGGNDNPGGGDNGGGNNGGGNDNPGGDDNGGGNDNPGGDDNGGDLGE